VLVNLMSVLGRTDEAKCLSINARRPEQIAVGANDPYVRVYDRRKLKAQLIDVSSRASQS
jgi:WD and tetratricopeptide repeat-containing protein 1